VLDSLGVGAMDDSAEYGDIGVDTLGNISKSVEEFHIPNLKKLGLANLHPLKQVEPVENPLAYYTKMSEVSKGKDTMTGHWEIMGLNIDKPFKVYPDGFPAELIAELEKRTGRKVLCNQPASGTQVIEDFGKEHMETGAIIVYTSADPVLQIAAHEEIIPLDELYKMCEIAREIMMGDNAVARVFSGSRNRTSIFRYARGLLLYFKST